MSATPLIELLDVHKSYRFGEEEVKALDGVDLRLDVGTFIGVIGRSGSGKSTLLNILGGLDRPSGGQVLLQGQPLRQRTSDDLATYRRQEIGFVFQSFNLVPHLSALENVALPLALSGVSLSERSQRARTLLEQVGLAKRTRHKPAELSGGERQRVAIARALANDPKILLADEPTGNLDSKTAEDILTMLTTLHQDGQRTVIMVTHDRERAERYCERLVIMEDGKVKEDVDKRSPATSEPPTDETPASEPAPSDGAGEAEAQA